MTTLKPRLTRQEQNLRAKAPSFDLLQRKDRFRSASPERLKAAPGALKVQPKHHSQQQVEGSSQPLPRQRLALIGAASAVRCDPIAMSAPVSRASRRFGASSRGEDKSASLNRMMLAMRVHHTVANTTLAAVIGDLQQTDNSVALGIASHNVGGTISRAAINHNHFGVPSLRAENIQDSIESWT